MDAKVIQKYSKKSIPSLIKIAVVHFHKFIRLRDCDENGFCRCISSNQQLRFGDSNCQAGHFYPGGKYSQLKFNEYNVNIQSKSDNYFNGGNIHDYRRNLIKKIGIKEVEKLDFIADISKRTNYKFNRFELIDIIVKYKQKCAELLKDKNFI